MAAGDFTTVGLAKRFLRLQPNVTADDGLLQELVNGVSAEFVTYMNRDIVSQSYMDVFDGKGTRVIMLRQYPVTAVTSVTLGPPNQPVTLIENIDYLWTATAIKRMYGIFPSGVGNVRVAYTAGFAAVPSDLQMAAAKGAAYRYQQLTHLGQNNKLMGQETVQFATDPWPEDIQRVLDQYQRVSPLPL